MSVLKCQCLLTKFCLCRRTFSRLVIARQLGRLIEFSVRKHSNALISANDIYSFTNIAVEREIWQKLKKLIICAAKADKTYFM